MALVMRAVIREERPSVLTRAEGLDSRRLW